MVISNIIYNLNYIYSNFFCINQYYNINWYNSYKFYKFNNITCLNSKFTLSNNTIIDSNTVFFKNSNHIYVSSSDVSTLSVRQCFYFNECSGVNEAKFFSFIDLMFTSNLENSISEFITSYENTFFKQWNIFNFLLKGHLFFPKKSDFKGLNIFYYHNVSSLFRLIKFNWSDFYYKYCGVNVIQHYTSYSMFIDNNFCDINLKKFITNYISSYYCQSLFSEDFNFSVVRLNLFKLLECDYCNLSYSRKTITQIVSLYISLIKLNYSDYNLYCINNRFVKLSLKLGKLRYLLCRYKSNQSLKIKLLLLKNIKLRTKKYFFLKNILLLNNLDKRTCLNLSNLYISDDNGDLYRQYTYSSYNFFNNTYLIECTKTQTLLFTSFMLLLYKSKYSCIDVTKSDSFNLHNTKIEHKSVGFEYYNCVNMDTTKLINNNYYYCTNQIGYLKSLFSFLNINKYSIVNVFSINSFYKNSIIFPFSKVSFLIHTYFFKNSGMLLNYLYFLKRHKKLVLLSKPSLFFFKFINRSSITFIVIDWFVKTRLDLFMLINYLFTLNKTLI